MEKSSLIYVAGHRGLIGSAILRALRAQGYKNILTRTRQELDLTDRAGVEELFARERPEYIFMAAAKVGGIRANHTYPADFIYQNLMLQTNILHSAYRFGAKKMMFLASSCVYPKVCPQPIREEYLLSGALEPTNEPYGIAKLAGIKMCQAYNRQYGTNFICVIPANVYGINDHFDENGHVTAGLLMKFHRAKTENEPRVTIWGSGRPRREFLYADDLALASLFLMDRYNDSGVINVGRGEETSIARLAEIIKEITGYEGEIVYDASKPDGIPRRLLDSRKIKGLGWSAPTELNRGLQEVYRWYRGQKTKNG